MLDILRYSMLSLVLILGFLGTTQSASAGVEVVYDFADHYSDAKITNAMSPGVSRSTVGGVTRRSIFLHPTAQEATAVYQVTLPKVADKERLVFAYSAGIRDGIPNDKDRPFNGVKFTLRIDGKEQFAADLKESKWVDRAADLTDMAGKRVEIVFATDPLKNSNYDWAAWGEPRILKFSKGLLGNSDTANTAKGIVVVDWTLGPNVVDIVPTGISAQNAGIHWESPKDAGIGANTAVIPFDFTKLGATGVTLHFTALIGGLDVYEFAPQAEIVSFGPAHGLVLAGKPTEFRCVVKNPGDGILHASAGAKAVVTGLPGANPQPIGDLAPGATKTLVWKGVKPSAGRAKVSVTVSGEGISTSSATWEGEVAKAPVLPAKVEKAEATRLTDGTVLLQNPGLRLAFLNGKAGYVGWIAYVPHGQAWKPVASGGPLGKVVTLGSDKSVTQTRVYPSDLKLINEAEQAPGVFFVTEKQIGGAQCHFEWLFSLKDSSKVSIEQSMTSSQPLDILHFAGPMVHAGDHGFGGTKDEGLFPGLEYLLTESSSGTENADPPYNLRTVPHPNKITIPFMAVRNGSTLVSLEWDPLQKWDSTTDRPSALFASPNFLDGQDNHKMGLFAPSVPEWITENQQLAAKAYALQPGKKVEIKADLMVKQDSKSILDAVDIWLAGHKLPAIPQTETPDGEYLNLCDKAYFGGAWDDAAKAWKHTNTHSGSFDPMIANVIWNRANYYLEPEPKKRLMDHVGSVVEKAKDHLNIDIALLAGGVAGALERMGKQVSGQIASQKPDGSWPFTPDKEHEVFGKPGDSSSGHTANTAIRVLRYALISGDKKARESGLKALDYLDGQIRPEGAQTWELQLHVPDILASGRIVEAYLSGYELTDDKKYLDKAVYWAKSGLPFVYLWNAPDRPIMRYGTIPVFGVTWFHSTPWFGNIVQWCGLDYAYSLERLAYYDESMPWKQISEGILKCGVQQQDYIAKKYPHDAGMYPDAFSAVTGEETYHWDLNPRLISRLILQHFGADAFPRTAGITDKNGQRMAITAPANIVRMKLEGEFLKIYIVGAPKATLYMVLSGVHDPTSIALPDRNIKPYASIEGKDEGFVHMQDKGLTIIKMQTVPEINLTVDLLGHYMYINDQAEAKQKEQPGK